MNSMMIVVGRGAHKSSRFIEDDMWRVLQDAIKTMFGKLYVNSPGIGEWTDETGSYAEFNHTYMGTTSYSRDEVETLLQAFMRTFDMDAIGFMFQEGTDTLVERDDDD